MKRLSFCTSTSVIALAWLASTSMLGCEKPAQSAAARPEAPPQTPARPATQPTPQPAQTQQAPRPDEAPRANEQPAQQPAIAPGAIPSAFSQDGTRRTCAQLAPREGFECVETPNGPVHVLSQRAPANVDPCASAVCPEGTRCESSAQNIGNAEHRLPHCVATRPLANSGPTRDPCGGYLCPLGYHCTAPADAPYCVPQSAGW